MGKFLEVHLGKLPEFTRGRLSCGYVINLENHNLENPGIGFCVPSDNVGPFGDMAVHWERKGPTTGTGDH